MASLLLGVGTPAMVASKSLILAPSLSFSKSRALIQSPLRLSSFGTSTSPTSIPFVYCGRGDRKTARGKRFSHSFGNARPKDKKKGRGPPRVYAPPLPPRKDKYDDGEVVKIEIDESLFAN